MRGTGGEGDRWGVAAMLRDPKLSRCATLVECVCVNVFRKFEHFFFNVTSVTLLSQSVLIPKLRPPIFNVQPTVPVVDDRLSSSPVS